MTAGRAPGLLRRLPLPCCARRPIHCRQGSAGPHHAKPITLPQGAASYTAVLADGADRALTSSCRSAA